MLFELLLLFGAFPAYKLRQVRGQSDQRDFLRKIRYYERDKLREIASFSVICDKRFWGECALVWSLILKIF